nr:RNA-directed DNA polymerase, eukaryota, reverse transcriptase zinc-binding domain protein [Tanacetum cinerariifolium]
MGFLYSKEDDVLRISTSVFVTNFPDHVGAKDLWHACKQYGHVVDAYIHDRRSKAGKRFGFVHFIIVFDVDRLVGNLCTVWIGNYHLHANAARFTRPSVKNNRSFDNKTEKLKVNTFGTKPDNAARISSNSNVARDMVMRNEGFSDIELCYLGGLWVMIVIKSMEIKEKFLSCVAIKSWFEHLIQNHIDGIIAWVDLEGITLKLWTFNSFKKIASKWVLLLNDEMSKDFNLHSKRLCWIPDFDEQSEEDIDSGNEQSDDGVKENVDGNEDEQLGEDKSSVVPKTLEAVENIVGAEYAELKVAEENQSSDPFGVYNLLKDKRVHEFNEFIEVKSRDKRNKNEGVESVGSGHFQKMDIPKSGGSILSMMDELIKVGQTMRFKMDGCIKNIEDIVAMKGVDDIDSPSTSAITLDRFLSDHRPILLREAVLDFGPTPFRLWNGARQSEKNKRRVLQQELGHLDLSIDKGNTSVSILQQRMEVCKSLKEMDKLISMEMAQKAKIKWAVEGDENSKYYHGILNRKRNQLAIRGVLSDGVWEERPNVVKNEFFNHFRIRFDRPNSVRPILEMDFPNCLSTTQKEDLEAVVSNEEIKKAVWDCGADKSPGPDGFTFGFFKRLWDLIESDVVAAVKSFFESGIFYKGCNSSFIALIPKIPNAKFVKDFRQICLIGSLYKIISKVLANRLVLVLDDLVNEVQSAFVADKQILDGPFILNEVYQWCKAKRKQSFVLKIDFEKAYDSVRWDYVGDVLRKFGFGEKWCGWIHECFHSSRGSVLVNGSPSIEFQFYKGLKQGDPLAPFLFILVMESLHLSFNRVVDAGLCIHVSKSKLMGIAVNDDCVHQAANRIGCGILKVPFTYLGSRVGGNISRICSWDEIVEKLITRLSKWKMNTLSIGGRLTLLKAVLGSVPIYYMSLFKVPMNVLHRMETIRSRFFNGVDLNSKKSIWVRWSKVLASKEKGGLGVSSFYALNRALMFKRVWRFKTQKEMLWSRVIKAIHGVNGRIGSHSKIRYKSIWCDIIREVETVKDDVWICDTPLKLRYPRLYALEINKEINVVCKMSHGSPSCSFRRKPRSGVEQSQIEGLMELLEGVTLGTYRDR